jgi:hypothetical protein
MGVLEQFAVHFISTWPNLSDLITGFIIVALFIISPFVVYLILKERYNKGRFIFEKKGHGGAGEANYELLYMLDTMKGTLYSILPSGEYEKLNEITQENLLKK